VAKQGLEHIIIRNQFYYQNYRGIVLTMLLLFVILFGLLGFALYQRLTPPKPLYFATSPDGRPIPIIPLRESLYTPDFVLEWAKKAVIATYSLDFVTYRQSLQEAQAYFTWKGHADFMEAYRQSNNLEAVKNRKQVVSAEIRGPGQVLSNGLNENGIYAWKLTIPITFVYENSENELIRQVGTALLTIERDSLLRHAEGIAISQLVFQAQ
jgi:intracellular multiplication protein IcmL